MRRLVNGTKRFLQEEEGGQALLLVLCFLVPMVLAFGMVVRTDNAVIDRIQLSHAADAAALAGGNMYARAMNQIAVNNLQIVKIASTQVALTAAIVGSASVFYKMFISGEKGGKEGFKNLKGYDFGEVGKVVKALRCWWKVFRISARACWAALKATVALIETVVGAIIAGAVALVACAITVIAAACVICEAFELVQYASITQWWAVETFYMTKSMLTGYSQGNALIEQLSRQNIRLVQELPDQMAAEMTRVAKFNRVDDAFLVSKEDFRKQIDLDVSRTLVRGGLSKTAGFAMYGFNGAGIWDAIRFFLRSTADGFGFGNIKFDFLASNGGVFPRGAVGNREAILTGANIKRMLNLDWNAGMLYFEGPPPDTYKTSFPWGEIFENFGPLKKLHEAGKDVFKVFGGGSKLALPWKIILGGVELMRTTSDIFATETKIPRGPIY
jgi:hypothetical protein